MRLNKTYWLQLAAVMMLLMQAAGLHAHISVDAGAASVQGHLQLADAHIDSHTSDSEPSDDAPELLTQAAWPKHQGNMGWALPVFSLLFSWTNPPPRLPRIFHTGMTGHALSPSTSGRRLAARLLTPD
jgi:hypothetical protein